MRTWLSCIVDGVLFGKGGDDELVENHHHNQDGVNEFPIFGYIVSL